MIQMFKGFRAARRVTAVLNSARNPTGLAVICLSAMLVAPLAAVRGMDRSLSLSADPGTGGDSLTNSRAFMLMDDAPAAGATQPSEAGGGSDDAGELANKLSNPVASLISVPFQSNFDFNGGEKNDKFKYTLNVQPVIPMSISQDWNLITRIIMPVIYQEAYFPGQGDNFGTGDTTPSFFFSPKAPWHGWIWGAGPVFLLPTATDTALGSGKWGAGPTIVVLQQTRGWTVGLLANHIWSFAGDDDRPYVNSTFLQPFIAYNTKKGTGITINTESTYDWRSSQWNTPIGLFFSQVLKIDKQIVSIQAGPRYYAQSPEGGSEWGFRINITLLFPK